MLLMILKKIRLQPRREEGQGLAEYALILALIAVLAIAALLVLSGAINDILSTVGDCLNNAEGCA